MNKLNLILTKLTILLMLILCTSCSNDKKYLSDTKLAYDKIVLQTTACTELYNEYIGAARSAFEGTYSVSASTYIANEHMKLILKDMYSKKPDLMFKIEDSKIEELMKNINKPPKKHEGTYNKMLEIYGKFTEVRRYVQNPSVNDLLNSNIKNRLEEISTLKHQLDIILSETK